MSLLLLLNPDTWGAAGEHVSRIRLRALDQLLKGSEWDVSEPFTVIENAAPTISLVSPADGGLTSGNMPYIEFDVGDADGDGVHVELWVSLRPDFGSGYHIQSALSQERWEESDDEGETWSPLGSGGATPGNRVRWQAPALRFDLYFLKARAFDSILNSDYLATTTFRVTPSGEQTLTCTIGTESYDIRGLNVQERTGGEASPFSFVISLKEFLDKPVAKGAPVSIGFCHPKAPDHPKVWNGYVVDKPNKRAEVTISCVQDDYLLARTIVYGNLSAADIGANLAALVSTYSGTLTGNNIDTALGVSAAITGNLQTLLTFFKKWADLLGLILWVDSDADIHLKDPADLPDPVYILHEGYE